MSHLWWSKALSFSDLGLCLSPTFHRRLRSRRIQNPIPKIAKITRSATPKPVPDLEHVKKPGDFSSEPSFIVVIGVVVGVVTAEVVAETNTVAGTKARPVGFQRSSTPYSFQPSITEVIYSEVGFVVPFM
jgi:hypothetical protein